MDGQACPLLLGDGGDLAHEFDQISAQVLDRHVLVKLERAPEAFPVVGEVARGQPVDERPLELLLFDECHRLEAFARGGDAVRSIVALGVFASEDEEIISGKIDRVEAQSRSAVRKRPVEIRPRPVGDGHKVIAEGLHAGARSIADRLLVVIDLGAEGA